MAGDILSGKLNVGEKLPPHRDLAWRLKVTVGTVTRAYKEAEIRGLLSGEVGRGSYVREDQRFHGFATPPGSHLANGRPQPRRTAAGLLHR